MRVALCYSGQARDAQVTQPNHQECWRRMFPADAELHYFFHLWHDPALEGQYLWPEHPGRGRYDSGNIRFLQDAYGAAAVTTEIPRTLDPQGLTPDARIPHPLQNTLAMFYSIREANRKKVEYEHTSGHTLDVVVRLRTDTYFREFPGPVSQYNLNCVHVKERSHLSYGLGDQFAFGSSAVMDVYSGVFDAITDHVASGCAVNPECFLGYHLRHHQIPVVILGIDQRLARDR